MKDKLIELIENTDKFNKSQKGIFKSFVTNSYEEREKYEKDVDLIYQTDSLGELSFEILISNESFKIYKLVSIRNDFDSEVPFRLIYKNEKNGRWERCSIASPSLDLALLLYFQVKYLPNHNSDFVQLVANMLGIKNQ